MHVIIYVLPSYTSPWFIEILIKVTLVGAFSHVPTHVYLHASVHMASSQLDHVSLLSSLFGQPSRHLETSYRTICSIERATLPWQPQILSGVQGFGCLTLEWLMEPFPSSRLHQRTVTSNPIPSTRWRDDKLYHDAPSDTTPNHLAVVMIALPLLRSH